MTGRFVSDDSDEMVKCDHCGTPTPIDALVHHGDDYDVCGKCSDQFLEGVRACFHVFSLEERDPDWNEPGRYCNRCGVWWDQDWAVSWFPLICDGFVDVPGDAA